MVKIKYKMEGTLHLYKGMFKGFGPYKSIVDSQKADFVLVRKNGTQKLRIHLDSCANRGS